MNKKLSIKELYFITNYILDKNATQAAIKAGYAEHSARQTAAHLLSKDYIRREIAKRLRHQFIRLDLKADDIIAELCALAKIDLRDAFNPDGTFKAMKDLPDELARAISAVEMEDGKVKKVKFNDKIRALELLGKHLKLFAELHTFDGQITHHHKISLEEVTDEHKRRVTSNLGIIQRYGALGSGVGQN